MLKTIPPRFASDTFLGFPLCTEIDSIEADVAIIGIPYGDPYSMDEVTNDQTNATSAIRLESARLSIGLDQWDFDLEDHCSVGKTFGSSTVETFQVILLISRGTIGSQKQS